MSQPARLRIIYFVHSVVSCWNNGNAHFQRGVLQALHVAGHSPVAAEKLNGWSRENLLADQGVYAEQEFRSAYPDLVVRTYVDENDLAGIVEGAEIVLVHEWNDPEVVSKLGQLRTKLGFMLLFHDTHHRAVSDPNAIRRFDLSEYDGVLAFGEALAEIYRSWGWGRRVRVWHEAADTTHFSPPIRKVCRTGATWIGNWGEDERASELKEFLLEPTLRAGVPLDIHGVRYSDDALSLLQTYEASYCGWVSNARVPKVFAKHVFTVHVPRRFYTMLLPGIPTIRVFEALSCGIPLVSAPWTDSEQLFQAGIHYLAAKSSAEAERHMRRLINEPDLCESLAAEGRAHIVAYHSCDKRAQQLLAIVMDLRSRNQAA